jgi:hypothetical protein
MNVPRPDLSGFVDAEDGTAVANVGDEEVGARNESEDAHRAVLVARTTPSLHVVQQGRVNLLSAQFERCPDGLSVAHAGRIRGRRIKDAEERRREHRPDKVDSTATLVAVENGVQRQRATTPKPRRGYMRQRRVFHVGSASLQGAFSDREEWGRRRGVVRHLPEHETFTG